MYYGYYMLPDGTFCLAPPPPGIDASSYYSNMTSAGMAPQTSSALPNLATTPTPSPSETTAMAPPAAAPPQVTSSAAPAVVPDTRLEVMDSSISPL